ncbi:hypothetical protein GSI_12627 [Ganoderma sinense ZZ0214-1]|uniref:BTB domain-containing protein n=1 Tax=Ganoderma sinense ZZ0214-1 TaxID=1077348 RepID=A0A2G8RTA2_9APHY|nr:hypothetical protein GSI_12627 [Ganoderma sinense ZZ0214-1]
MSSAPLNAAIPTVAPPPFNQLSADITLRTSDLVDFHVHTQILSQASLLFAAMLSLPQPPSSSGTHPIIDVLENSRTLENLLRLCYPIDRIPLTSVADIGSVLDAANKYEMQGPLSAIIPDLLALAPHSPLKVWAVACRSGIIFESIAWNAATAMVAISKDRRRLAKGFGRLFLEIGSPSPSNSRPFPPFTLLQLMLRKYGVDATRGASAGDYYRLLEYLRAGKEGSTANLMRLSVDTPPSGAVYSPPSFDEVIPRFPPPDLKIQCCDGTQHAAHIIFLSAHSPTLGDRIRALVGVSLSTSSLSVASSPLSDCDSEPPLPVLEVDVDSASLSILLVFCYAGCASNVELPTDLRLLSSTLIAARKLNMERVADTVKEHWERAALADPLEAYFVAIARGQEDLARFAARHALEGRVVGAYVRGMEACSALAYHHLLEYHDACVQAARDVVRAAMMKLQGDSDRLEWKVAKLDELEAWQSGPDVHRGDPSAPLAVGEELAGQERE